MVCMTWVAIHQPLLLLEAIRYSGTLIICTKEWTGNSCIRSSFGNKFWCTRCWWLWHSPSIRWTNHWWLDSTMKQTEWLFEIVLLLRKHLHVTSRLFLVILWLEFQRNYSHKNNCEHRHEWQNSEEAEKMKGVQGVLTLVLILLCVSSALSQKSRLVPYEFLESLSVQREKVMVEENDYVVTNVSKNKVSSTNTF